MGRTGIENDYHSESSYINAPIDHKIVAGANTNVDGFDHNTSHFVLPYSASVYKAGNADVTVPTEGAIAWHQTSPADVRGDDGKLPKVKNASMCRTDISPRDSLGSE